MLVFNFPWALMYWTKPLLCGIFWCLLSRFHGMQERQVETRSLKRTKSLDQLPAFKRTALVLHLVLFEGLLRDCGL